MCGPSRRMHRWMLLLVLAPGAIGPGVLLPREEQAASPPAPPLQTIVSRYCHGCHSSALRAGGLVLDTLSAEEVGGNPDVWEKVLRKIRARHMPPIGMPRPDGATYEAMVSSLETSLDRAAAANPDPGRTETFRRLTRTEFQNAVRDLLALEVDAASLLPPDETSFGFDNVNAGSLPPTLLERYMSAAEKISRLAVGRPGRSAGGETVRLPADLTQEEHLDGLPIGTRGGTAIRSTFPQDGEYDVRVRLTRDRNEHVEGLSEPHQLEVLLDRARVALFDVKPPARTAGTPEDAQPSHDSLDRHLSVRVRVRAGPHTIGATFLKKPSVLLETGRQPYQAHFNYYRHPRIQPAVFSISVSGPFAAEGPGDTPSRKRILICRPEGSNDDDGCARRILSTLVRRAYRRPVTEADLAGPLALYRTGRAEGGFEAGIEMALAAVLVSPHFLFRIEQDPPSVPAKTVYRIGDLDLATRLSFFLWSSIPDDELLNLSAGGRLKEKDVWTQQVRRMLADPRSQALVSNFASQWLHLRKLDSTTPDMRLFPDFDDNLRQAFRRETELFFESVLREDRSVLSLLSADYTFLNERLARHYGIPHVYGSRFRRVALGDYGRQGGLLRQASVLTVTSYATRTSPVVRGKWILDNLLGVPPPPPLPDVPALKDNTVDGGLSVRRRLAEHRANAACAPCHNLMDPVGLSFEKFDAIGRRRDHDGGNPIDDSGGLPDGRAFTGVDGLEKALLEQPEMFVATFVEKLLTYALGRGLEYYDAPAVRAIVRKAREQNYRVSSIILGVVQSNPFQLKRAG